MNTVMRSVSSSPLGIAVPPNPGYRHRQRLTLRCCACQAGDSKFTAWAVTTALTGAQYAARINTAQVAALQIVYRLVQDHFSPARCFHGELS